MLKLTFCMIASAVMMTTTMAGAQDLPPNVTMTLKNDNKETASEPLPRLKVLDELAHNAGEVETPGSVDHNFTFKNEGDAPLEIKEVKSGCGCLIANYDPLIQPGENGVISISMKLYPEWEGREVSRTTWVITNDPENRQIRLTLSAKAKAANGSAASAGK